MSEVENMISMLDKDTIVSEIVDGEHFKDIYHYCRGAAWWWKSLQNGLRQYGYMYRLWIQQSKGMSDYNYYMQHCLPRGKLRNALLESYHKTMFSGHPGISKSYACLSTLYCWPMMFPDVTVYITSCLNCEGPHPGTTIFWVWQHFVSAHTFSLALVQTNVLIIFRHSWENTPCIHRLQIRLWKLFLVWTPWLPTEKSAENSKYSFQDSY